MHVCTLKQPPPATHWPLLLTAGSEDGDAETREPLLIRIDADDAGSVGSADTSGGCYFV